MGAPHQDERRVRVHQGGADHRPRPASGQQEGRPRQGRSHRSSGCDHPCPEHRHGPREDFLFQALQIPTKITKGTIEIIQDVPIIRVGDRVGASEATLLNMLKISPFTYGLLIQKVYDNGSIFDPEILDITDEDIKAKFMAGVANVAALCLSINYPTIASVPHSIVNGMKN